MIHVIASIDVNEGSHDAFLAAFHELVPVVRAEPGCVEYGPTVDVEPGLPRQVDHRPDTVTIIEQWESIDALTDHLAAPHMADYREKVKDLVAGVTLQVLETA
jgi:quinol monooxygenase YgiN